MKPWRRWPGIPYRTPDNPVILNPTVFASGWTPASIATALWFDATDAASLTLVSGAASQWNDKSGNGRHATQGTAANRPTHQSSGINGLAALSFDGSNDSMTVPVFSLGSTFIVLAVAVANSATTRALFSARAASGNAILPQMGFFSGASSFQVRDDAANNATSTQSGASTATIYVVGGVRSGNSVTAYRDGTAATAATNTFGTITPDKMIIGAAAAASLTNFFSGRLGELIAAPADDATTRQKIEGYLAHKWGTTAALPAGHPYKSAPP